MSHLKRMPRKLVMFATGGQSLTSGDWRKIAFDAPTINTANFTKTNNVFTCTIPGIYLVMFRVEASASVAVANPSLYINGSSLAYSVLGSSLSAGNTIKYGLNITLPVKLAIGDTISFYVYPVETMTATANTLLPTELELIS